MRIRQAATSFLVGGAVVAVATLGVGIPLTATASAATSAVSSQDQAFMADNAMTNMAEIGAGKVMESKGASSAIRSTAATVVAQHTEVLAKLQALASETGVTLPTTLTAAQQAESGAVNGDPAGVSLDTTYAEDEITGHELSISQTNTEIASGSDPSVTAFARYYLPYAQMHLEMFQADLGEPSSVNAGSGGRAAPTSGPSLPLEVGLGVGGVLLIGWSARRLRRRHSAA